MDQETKEFLEKEFSKLATKEEFHSEISRLDDKIDYVKASMQEQITDVKISLTKQIDEVKTVVDRLDKRTDEDIRATMKDVAEIKTVLREHQFPI